MHQVLIKKKLTHAQGGICTCNLTHHSLLMEEPLGPKAIGEILYRATTQIPVKLNETNIFTKDDTNISKNFEDLRSFTLIIRQFKIFKTF